jgi:cobalt-zinc-cadmium resistance protein CzcA
MIFATLIRFALSQRLLICLLSLLLLGFGGRAMLELPIDAYPEISPTQVKIIIKAPGMTPEEVENLITQPIEVELLGIPRQTILRSISKYALTSITLDFEEGTDIYWARQQVTERLNGVWENLPAGIGGGLAPISTPLSEMFMFTIDNDRLSLAEKRFLLDWTIRPALRTVPGVADVNALGGFVRTYEVTPRREAMASLGVSTAEIAAALSANNRNDGAGRIDQGEEAILVRVSGALGTLEDIRNTVVESASGKKIPLSELATVAAGTLERYGAVTSNGTGEAVQGLVIGLRGANAREIVDGVRAKLDALAQVLPEGTTTQVFYDRRVLIENAVTTVTKALLEAVVLVVVLLGLFLGNLRAALTVALVLPLSALVTFLLMRQMGMSANLMSLGGLAIAIGMLVDSAIVIVENIEASLAHQPAGGKRLPTLHIIYRAVKDVAVPVTSGIAIIVIVFLPLLTLQGLEGKLFGPVTLTIVFALAGSLLLSFTIIPVVASFLVKATAHGEPWLSRKLSGLYRPALDYTLRKPALLLVLAGLLLAGSAVVFPRVGKTFMPTMDEGDILIQLEMIPSINLDTANRMVQQVERALLAAVPEITRIVSRTGSDELGLDPMGLNETDMFLQLKPAKEWRGGKSDLEDRLREVMDRFPGLNYGFTQPIDMRVSEMLTGSRGDVAIKVFGPDLAVLNDTTQRMATVLEKVPGSSDVIASVNEGAQYLQVAVDRVAAGRAGIDGDELQARLRAEIEGAHLGSVVERGARVPLVLRYPKRTGDALEELSNSFVELPGGGVMPLASLATIKRVDGPVVISRERGQRFAVVRTNVEGRDLVGFVESAQEAIAREIKLPGGYTLEWGGQFENQQRAAARLALVVPVALALIALLLFMTFGSVKQTLVILSNIPFALTGGLLALWITGEFLSVPASVGFIALLGIAVLNGVVMMSHFNYLQAKGLVMARVVREGAVRRLRPVMMTASICAFGLVPLLLASGPGSEIQRPLAIVVIGGLVSSTLLTLFLLPVIYERFLGVTPAAKGAHS